MNPKSSFPAPTRSPHSRLPAAPQGPAVPPRSSSLKSPDRTTIPASSANDPGATGQAPAIVDNASNLSFQAANPPQRPPHAGTYLNPFEDPNYQPAPWAGANPFLDPDRPYAQPAADGQAVPQIFGKPDHPTTTGSDNPFLNGQYEQVLANNNPFINGAGSSSTPPVPATSGSDNPFLNGQYEKVLANNNPFINGAGSSSALPIPRQPWPSSGTVDPTNPFFAQPDAGMLAPPRVERNDPPIGMPLAADTPAVAAAKGDVARNSVNHVYWKGLYERILQTCEALGLPPNEVRGMLDAYLDNIVTAVEKAVDAERHTGLNAKMPDPQTEKAAALARRAEAGRQAELKRYELDKKRSGQNDEPTFDPLSRRTGNQRPLSSSQGSVKQYGSSHSSSSGSHPVPLRSTPTPSLSRSTSQLKIPSSTSISDGDDGADNAGESSSADDELEMSQTQSDSAPRVVTQAGGKAQERLARQQRYQQDDLESAALKKRQDQRMKAVEAQAQLFHNLEQQLAAEPDAGRRKQLVQDAKNRADAFLKQTEDAYGRIQIGTDMPNASQTDRNARMAELRLQNEFADSTSTGIVGIGLKFGVDLRS